mgnify:CR=1 FL=1
MIHFPRGRRTTSTPFSHGTSTSLLGLPFGLFEVWRNHRAKAAAVAIGLAACLNPAMYVLRLTGGGWEVSNRSSEFLYISIGFVIALGLVNLQLPRLLHWARNQIALPLGWRILTQYTSQ